MQKEIIKVLDGIQWIQKTVEEHNQSLCEAVQDVCNLHNQATLFELEEMKNSGNILITRSENSINQKNGEEAIKMEIAE